MSVHVTSVHKTAVQTLERRQEPARALGDQQAPVVPLNGHLARTPPRVTSRAGLRTPPSSPGRMCAPDCLIYWPKTDQNAHGVEQQGAKRTQAKQINLE